MRPKSLYIHIPFCEKICAYCDFAKVMNGTFSHMKYLANLFKELEEEEIPFDSLKTIYIGGGTPSCLTLDELNLLLSYLYEHFPSVEEFTLEANPESLDKDKIRLCQMYGVNRISLGAQAASDDILKTLNRNHRMKDLIRCCDDLHELHFDNFNLDFIYGLPGMTKKDLDDDIELSLKLKSKHLSYYSLQIEKGTMFYNKHIKAQDDEVMREMYDYLIKKLHEAGFKRYEVSNFAIPGYESRHNLTYWHDEPYYAVGLSASGYINQTRFTNTHSMTKYMKGLTDRATEEISSKSEEFEFLMLNLRLVSGFSLDKFKERFHKDFLVSYQKEIKKVEEYVQVKDGYFAIKPEYLYTMDHILLELLK